LDRNGTWEDLLARANEGDGKALARFLTEVSPMLRRLIRARGRALPPDQHEDILQEVLFAIHLKRQSWQSGAPVRPWLYAIARYKVVDAFRRRGTEVHLPIEDFIDSLESEAPENAMAGRDADWMLGQLDARSASLVRAVRLGGQSPDEAGARLGLSPGATRVALHRAIQRLARLAERLK
jgi:RNA polymerase sigma factor (sigma-70 family)